MRRLMVVGLAVILALLLLVPVASAQGGGGVVVSGETVIESGQTYDGSMVVFGGKLTVRQGGTINGDLAIFGGEADISGTVNGDVVVFGGSTALRSTAVITGNLTTIGGSIERAPNAQVRGRITSPGGSIQPGQPGVPNIPGLPAIPGQPGAPNAPQAPVVPVRPSPIQQTPQAMILGFLGWVLRTTLITLGVGVLGILAVVLLPNQLTNVADTMRMNTAASTGMGALTWLVWIVAIPLIAIVSALLTLICIGLLGFPILIVLAIALPVALLLGWLATGYVFGGWLLRVLQVSQPAPLVAAGLGTVLLTGAGLVLMRIPLCGGVLGWLLTLPGLGAVVLTWFGARAWRPGDPYLPSRRGSGPTTPPPPPPSGSYAAPLPAPGQTWQPPAPSNVPPASYAPPRNPATLAAATVAGAAVASTADDFHAWPYVDVPTETPAETVETATTAEAAPETTTETASEAPSTASEPVVAANDEAEAPTVVSPAPVYAGATVPRDDLKAIPGIGPVYEGLFNERGVTTYAQLSYLTVDQVRDILTSPEVLPVTDDQARAMIHEAGVKIKD